MERFEVQYEQGCPEFSLISQTSARLVLAAKQRAEELGWGSYRIEEVVPIVEDNTIRFQMTLKRGS